MNTFLYYFEGNLILTALMRNFYKIVLKRLLTQRDEYKKSSLIDKNLRSVAARKGIRKKNCEVSRLAGDFYQFSVTFLPPWVHQGSQPL
jgi:hypothetical protein